jgi:GDP-mannose 6-dehydrogenase
MDSAEAAVTSSELALICVGTPSRPDGGADLSALRRVARNIGAALTPGGPCYGVVIRSTCLPGTLAQMADWLAEASGGLEGGAFDVAANPEFLREGTAVADFAAPPFTVIGTHSARLAERLQALYAHVSAPVHVVDVGVAEGLKFACNAFHATKVVFANEVGRTLQAQGVDGRRVMELFCQDTVLNISPAYLRPGFAYGGSCLPKDVRALVEAAGQHGVETPLLAALERSNQLPVAEALQLIRARGRPATALVGLSFKPDTDDLRESPFLDLLLQLLAADLPVQVHDPDLQWELLHGSNLAAVGGHAQRVRNTLVPRLEYLTPPDVVLLGKLVPGLDDWLPKLAPDALVLDLGAGLPSPERLPCAYRGITW